MMRSGCSFKTATLISPADGSSLSTGYYSSPKLVGLHIFQCTTSELESSIQMRERLVDRMRGTALFYLLTETKISLARWISIKVTLETSDWKINMVFSLLTRPAVEGFINYWRYSWFISICLPFGYKMHDHTTGWTVATVLLLSVFINCLIRAPSFSCHLQSGFVRWQCIRCMIPSVLVCWHVCWSMQERGFCGREEVRDSITLCVLCNLIWDAVISYRAAALTPRSPRVAN